MDVLCICPQTIYHPFQKLWWCQMHIVIHAFSLFVWICFWNIAVYHIFQYWKVTASFCHCNKTVFFLLSVSTMAWFSHVMVKVLFFNIVYKECHFISTEYIYVFFFCHTFPSHQAGMSSTVSSFLFLLQCYSYVISISWIAAGCCCYTDIQVCLFVQFFWHFGPEI